MVDRRHHVAAPPHRPALRSLVAATSAALLLALAACGSGGDPQATPDVAAANQSAAPTPDPTPEPTTPPVDLAAFTAIGRADWETIAGDPEAAIGRQVIVYAVVDRYFSSTGPGVFQARVSTTQPAGPAEGIAAIVRAEPELVTDVATGAVVQLHAEVAGEFGGVSGGSRRTAELRAFAVSEVGFHDLAADVVVGAPVTAGGVTLPVTVTNSSDVTMDYRVDVMATSADGVQNYGTMTGRAVSLAPGQSAAANVRFSGALPAGAVFTLVNISRSSSPTL